VTWDEVENSPEASIAKVKPVIVKSKPVMAPEAMGETPMLPVITEVDTVEMPVFARMA
jgi:hypothetical protein